MVINNMIVSELNLNLMYVGARKPPHMKRAG